MCLNRKSEILPKFEPLGPRMGGGRGSDLKHPVYICNGIICNDEISSWRDLEILKSEEISGWRDLRFSLTVWDGVRYIKIAEKRDVMEGGGVGEKMWRLRDRGRGSIFPTFQRDVNYRWLLHVIAFSLLCRTKVTWNNHWLFQNGCPEQFCSKFLSLDTLFGWRESLNPS